MLVFFSIAPLGSGESVSGAVSQAVKLIVDSGLEYKVTAMGTIIEGPTDAVFDLLKACHIEMAKHHHRVTSKIMIDDRRDATGRLTSKIASIEEKLGRKLNQY